MSMDQFEQEVYSVTDDVVPAVDEPVIMDSRREAIARGAYLLAERRGFAPGHELEDWITAERQHDNWAQGCACDTPWR